MPQTPESYYDAVATHLAHLPRALREDALADLAELLTAGVSTAELGNPADYAATLTSPADDDAPRLLGIPYAAPHSPLWNPASPHLLLPKKYGIGWTVNLGALAVKLGWLRPDDADVDVLTAAPTWAWVGSSLIPAACEAVTLGSCVVAWRRSEGGQLPWHWGRDSRPDAWADRRLVVGALYATAVGATVTAVTTSLHGAAAQDDAPADTTTLAPDRALSRLATSALAGGLAAVGAVFVARSAADPSRARPGLPAALLLVPSSAALGAALLPIRAGLRRVTRKANS